MVLIKIVLLECAERPHLVVGVLGLCLWTAGSATVAYLLCWTGPFPLVLICYVGQAFFLPLQAVHANLVVSRSLQLIRD